MLRFVDNTCNAFRLKIKKAVIFADDEAVECLKWSKGFSWLLDVCDVQNVKRFDQKSRGSVEDKKAVFLISRPIYGNIYKCLTQIVKNSHFELCIVVTCASSSVHWFAANRTTRPRNDLDLDNIFYSIEDRVAQDMGNINFTAEVLNLPISCFEIISGGYLLPVVSHLFPLFPWHDITYNIRNSLTGGSSLSSLPDQMQLDIKILADLFNGFLEQLNTCETILTLGSISKLLGTEIEDDLRTKTRRKVSDSNSLLLIVDRSLDLTSSLSSNIKSTLDYLFRINSCKFDINFSQGNKNRYTPLFSLSSLSDSTEIKNIFEKPFKTVLENIFENEDESSLDRSNPLTTINQTHLTDMDQFRVLITNTIQDPKYDTLKMMQSTENLLLQNIISSEGPVQTLISLINERKINLISDEEILRLLCLTFAFCDETEHKVFNSQEDYVKLETQLIESFCNDENEMPEYMKKYFPESDERDMINGVKQLLNHLLSFSKTRNNFKLFNSVIKSSESTLKPWKPLLGQIINYLFDPNLTDLVDLEVTQKRELNLLNLFTSSNVDKKPNIFEFENLIIFVVGGMAIDEMVNMKELTGLHNYKGNLIMLSSHISTPDIVMENVFDHPSFRKIT